MKSFRSRNWAICRWLVTTTTACACFAQVSVLTQHNDSARTGANLKETTLNTHNVNGGSFGALFSYKVDGQVYAQPLYVPNLIGGNLAPGKSVVYVATMHNKVYAFDADSNTTIWERTLAPYVKISDLQRDLFPTCQFFCDPVPVPGCCDGYQDTHDAVGIVSTPAISLRQKAIYVVALTKTPSGYAHLLYALDLVSGTLKPGSPMPISGGAISQIEKKTIKFGSLVQLQRAGLLLLPRRGQADGGEMLVMAFASYGDVDKYQGWVFGYDAATLQQLGVFVDDNLCDHCDKAKGGIWQAGQGVAADELAFLYFMTGNGDFEPAGIPAGNWALGDSVVSLDAGLALHDFFSPSNNKDLNNSDSDLGSAGPLLIPGTGLLVGGGKEGRLYLLRRAGLGGFAGCGNSGAVQNFQATGIINSKGDLPPIWGDFIASNGIDAFIQTITGSLAFLFGDHKSELTFHIHGSPVFWSNDKESRVYLWGENDWLRAYKFDGKTFPLSRDFFWPDPKTTLDELAREATVLSPFQANTLVIVWTGTGDGFLNVMQSPIGQCFSGKTVLSDPSVDARSDHQPGVAFGNGVLSLAWTGTDSKLSFIRTFNLQKFVDKRVPDEQSDHGPALAFGNNRFFVAWTGTDQKLNIMSSTNGVDFSNKFVVPIQESDAGPGLSFINGRLYLLWKGVSNNKLNIMEFFPSTKVSPTGNFVILDERSDFAPSLVGDTLSSRVYLAWTGRHKFLTFDIDRRLNLEVWPNITTLFMKPKTGRKFVLFDTSEAGPILTMFKDQLYTGWTGTDDKPNAAQMFHPEALTSEVNAPKGMPGGMLSISAADVHLESGIVWASLPKQGNANHNIVPGMLRAFDASTLRELWNSGMCPVRDEVGDFAKFSPPTIANGKVYLATFSGQVRVYGLNPGSCH